MRTRTLPPPRVFLLALALSAAALLFLGVQQARATQKTTVVSSVDDPHIQGVNGHYMRVDAESTGNIAYCAQGWLVPPKQGQTLELYGPLGIPELDYVLYHGYDGQIVTSLYGLDAERSETATSIAVWLAIAEQRGDILTYRDSEETYHGNKGYMTRWELQTDQGVKDAAWKLYQAGLSYKDAGGGGVEAGCAQLWTNRISLDEEGAYGYQDLVTVTKKIKARFTKTSANLDLTEGNTTYSLAGARYDIFRTDGDAKVASIETDRDGKASVSLEPNTSYYAVETAAPQGYILNPSPIEFKTGINGADVPLEDTAGRLAISIAKKDAAANGTAQPGATLEAAAFRVSSLSRPGWEKTVTTDRDGEAVVEGIPLGTVQVVETKAPEGYALDGEARTYTVTGDDLPDSGVVELAPKDDFPNRPIAFDIDIMKFTSSKDDDGSRIEKPAGGVVFRIISNTTGKEVGSIRTDDAGHATSEGEWFGSGKRTEDIGGALPYDRGGYTVKEDPDTVPKGFKKVDDWVITADQMADGATLRYIVNNEEITSRLQIVKRDAATGEVAPLAGFSFQVLDALKHPITQTSWYPREEKLDTFTTDGSGMVTLPQQLRAGTYYLHEVKAVAPYLLNGEDLAFNIPDDGMAPVAIVEIADERATGSATISKRCSEDGAALEGAEYDVVAQEDIMGPIGELVHAKGSVVGHVKTDKDGTGTVRGLSLGTGKARYAFVETVAPEGHVLDSTPIPFELVYRDQETATVSASLDAEDAPTHIKLHKGIAGKGESLAGARFQLWDASDELAIEPSHGMGAIAIHGVEGEVTLVRSGARARIALDIPEGARVTAAGDTGERTGLSADCELPAGTYSFFLIDSQGERIPRGLETVEVHGGSSYTLRIKQGLLGLEASLDAIEDDGSIIGLSHDAENDVWLSEDVAVGTYQVLADGKMLGEAVVAQGSVTYLAYSDGALARVPVILKADAKSRELVTDEDGDAEVTHLPNGRYRIAESDAPDGYLIDPSTRTITIGPDGRVAGKDTHHIEVEDDFTKVDLSKRDISNEEELEGAELEVIDAEGNVIESWTSGSEPHRIEALAPGAYVLREHRTPRSHDAAEDVTFTVLETGDIQTVTMYDRPIEIEGQVDKRQEVVQPIAAGSIADADEARASVRQSEDGSFSYTVDARNLSGTWVDEFTIEDGLVLVEDGLAELSGITTPQATGDRDGLMNVWYRTDRAGDSADNDVDISDGGANATRSDGHENPWIEEGDGRELSYRGWSIWAEGIDARSATRLSCKDLQLAEGEHVTGIRFEYGCVDTGFTTREGSWDRDDLKDTHDDIDEASKHDDDHVPAIIHMTVTDSYRAGTPLMNDTAVHLYRNGGGEGLEDHDYDHVVQAPREDSSPLDQTGTIGRTAGIFTIGTLLSSWAIIRARKTSGPGNRRTPRIRR